MVPPRWVRRLAVAPTMVLLIVLFLGSLPVLLVAAAAVSPRLPGRWRPLRLLWFFLVYLAVEVVTLTAALGLWVESGFGRTLHTDRMRNRHYRLLRWSLARVFNTARRAFSLTFDTSEVEGVLHHDPDPDGPLLVFSRHAGAGDSLILVHALCEAGRRPRIVLKETLQWDPLLDVILNRLPTVFVGSRPGRLGVVEGIRALAGDMGPYDALLLFPEGGNFTEARRTRSIAKLEELKLRENTVVVFMSTGATRFSSSSIFSLPGSFSVGIGVPPSIAEPVGPRSLIRAPTGSRCYFTAISELSLSYRETEFPREKIHQSRFW